MFTRWRKKPPPVTGGEQARKKAERDLERVRAETREYEALAADLRRIGERNHLALAFILAAQGRRPTHD